MTIQEANIEGVRGPGPAASFIVDSGPVVVGCVDESVMCAPCLVAVQMLAQVAAAGKTDRG
jgi:hypothetical protein